MKNILFISLIICMITYCSSTNNTQKTLTNENNSNKTNLKASSDKECTDNIYCYCYEKSIQKKISRFISCKLKKDMPTDTITYPKDSYLKFNKLGNIEVLKCPVTIKLNNIEIPPNSEIDFDNDGNYSYSINEIITIKDISYIKQIEFFKNGNIKSGYLEKPVLINNIPCYEDIEYFENGNIASCYLSKSYKLQNLTFPKDTYLEFDDKINKRLQSFSPSMEMKAYKININGEGYIFFKYMDELIEYDILGDDDDDDSLNNTDNKDYLLKEGYTKDDKGNYFDMIGYLVDYKGNYLYNYRIAIQDFKHSKLSIAISPFQYGVIYEIRNISKKPIKLHLNESALIDNKDNVHPVWQEGKFIDRYKSKLPIIIPPNSKLNNTLMPTDTIIMSESDHHSKQLRIKRYFEIDNSGWFANCIFDPLIIDSCYKSNRGKGAVMFAIEIDNKIEYFTIKFKICKEQKGIPKDFYQFD